MLHNEITAICFEIHTKHINTLCGHKVEFFSVKFECIYSNKCALNWKATSHYPPPYLCS
jgi:hypothetical protein